MTEWHLSWQGLFPEECREVVIEEGGQRHRADVYLPESKTVIEFQHSPMASREFEERNAFYMARGRRLIWVYDVTAASEKENLSIAEGCYRDGLGWSHEDGSNRCTGSWSYARRELASLDSSRLSDGRMRVFLHTPMWDVAPHVVEVTGCESGLREFEGETLSKGDFIREASEVAERAEIDLSPLSGWQEAWASAATGESVTESFLGPKLSSLSVTSPSTGRRVAFFEEPRERGAFEAEVRRLRATCDSLDVVINMMGRFRSRGGDLTIDWRDYYPRREDYSDARERSFGGFRQPLMGFKLKKNTQSERPLSAGCLDWLTAGGLPSTRVFVSAKFQMIPCSKAWQHEGKKFCWPFVREPGGYVSKVWDICPSSIVLDAAETHPARSFLSPVPPGRLEDSQLHAMVYDKILCSLPWRPSWFE
jgi:hypothetical protein